MEAPYSQAELDRREARYWKLEDELTGILEAIEETEQRIRRRQEYAETLREVADRIRLEMQVTWMGGDDRDLD